MLADWAFVRRPHAFRAARQAAPAIPPACLLRGAPSRAGAWREIVLRFCANYISYYWICANSYWPLLDLQEELLANLRISIFCKKLSLQFSNFFLQISYFRLREETLLANFEILQLCKKLPFRAAHQVVPAIPPARHIKSSRQYRPRGTSSRPGNTARAAHTKSPRQYRPCGTSTFRCACSLLRLTRSPHPPRACLPDCSAVHPHSRKMCSQTKQSSDNQTKPRRTPSRARSSASAYLR